MNKEKEEKGFLRREVMQVTPLGYWIGSLAPEWCLCSCMTPLGHCPSLLATEQHQRWNLNSNYHVACVPIYPSSQLKQMFRLGLECVLTNQWLGRCYILQSRVVETKTNWELNNTFRGVRIAFHEQGPFRELEFYQFVTKCCSSYNHPPKFFLSFFLEPQIPSCQTNMYFLAKYTKLSDFLAKRQPVY